MVHAITLGLGLALLWALLSGHTDPLLIAFGVFSITTVVGVAWRMDVIDRESVPLQVGFGLVPYLGWLIWEIIKSNVIVVRAILSPGGRIAPRFIRVPTSQRNDLTRVIYANSITLTPGTVTVETEDGAFLVHALTDATADLESLAEMDRRVTRLEGEPRE